MLILGAILHTAFDASHEIVCWLCGIVRLVARILRLEVSILELLLLLQPWGVHALDLGLVVAISTHYLLLRHLGLLCLVADNFRLTSRLFQVLKLLLCLPSFEDERGLVLALWTLLLLSLGLLGLISLLRPLATWCLNAWPHTATIGSSPVHSVVGVLCLSSNNILRLLLIRRSMPHCHGCIK